MENEQGIWVEGGDDILLPMEVSQNYTDICNYAISKMREEEIESLVDKLLTDRKYQIYLIRTLPNNDDSIHLKLNVGVEMSKHTIELVVENRDEIYQMINKNLLRIPKKLTYAKRITD